MAEVNRIMEKISQQCEPAQVIMGAAIDPGMANKLSIALIAAKSTTDRIDPASAGGTKQSDSSIETNGNGLPEDSRFGRRSSTSPVHLREPMVPRGRPKRDKGKMIQPQLPLAIVSRGRFDKSEPTIHKGEDLDIPTYLRRGVPLN